ncbi:hypothetical protein M8494_08050 [Serratia ureilytica]
MRRQPAREGIVDVAGLMNVKTVDEQPRKQQRQQVCHKNDGDHFLHNFIPFPVGLNLLLVFARNFISTWVKILVLIVFSPCGVSRFDKAVATPENRER